MHSLSDYYPWEKYEPFYPFQAAYEIAPQLFFYKDSFGIK